MMHTRSMQFLTWDSAILTAFGLLVAYSLLIRKHKSLATLVSIYVAYVVASIVGPRISEFFAGDRVFLGQVWINANASPFMVESLLLVLITFLLSSFIKLGGKRSRYSPVEVIVYAAATMAVGVMCIVTFMDPGFRTEIMQTSQIVPWVYQFREWILIAPVFVIIFFGLYGNPDE